MENVTSSYNLNSWRGVFLMMSMRLEKEYFHTSEGQFYKSKACCKGVARVIEMDGLMSQVFTSFGLLNFFMCEMKHLPL